MQNDSGLVITVLFHMFVFFTCCLFTFRRCREPLTLRTWGPGRARHVQVGGLVVETQSVSWPYCQEVSLCKEEHQRSLLSDPPACLLRLCGHDRGLICAWDRWAFTCLSLGFMLPIRIMVLPGGWSVLQKWCLHSWKQFKVCTGGVETCLSAAVLFSPCISDILAALVYDAVMYPVLNNGPKSLILLCQHSPVYSAGGLILFLYSARSSYLKFYSYLFFPTTTSQSGLKKHSCWYISTNY